MPNEGKIYPDLDNSWQRFLYCCRMVACSESPEWLTGVWARRAELIGNSLLEEWKVPIEPYKSGAYSIANSIILIGEWCPRLEKLEEMRESVRLFMVLPMIVDYLREIRAGTYSGSISERAKSQAA